MSYTYLDEGEIDQNPMFSQYFRGTERMKLPQRQTDSLLEGFVITGRNSINPKIRRLALRPGSLAIMSTKKSRVVKEYFLSELIDVRQSSRRCFVITVRTEKDSRLSRSRDKLVVKRKVFETPGPQSTAKWVQTLRQACGKAAENQHFDPYAVDGLPINDDNVEDDDPDDDDDDDKAGKRQSKEQGKKKGRGRSLSDPPTPRTARRQAAAERESDAKKEKERKEDRRKSQLKTSSGKDEAEKAKEKAQEDDKSTAGTRRRATSVSGSKEQASSSKQQPNPEKSGRKAAGERAGTTRQRRSKTISSARPAALGNKMSISMPEIPQIDLLSPAPASGAAPPQYGSGGQQLLQPPGAHPHQQAAGHVSMSTPDIGHHFDPFGGVPQRHSQHFQTWTGPPPAFLSEPVQLPSAGSAGSLSSGAPSSNGSTGPMSAQQLFDQQRAQLEQQRKQLDEEIRTHQQKLAELNRYPPSGPKFILSTLSRQEGMQTDKEFGVVSGCGTVAAPKSKEEVQQQLELARANAESELAKQAKLLGANAVFSVGYTTSLHSWGVTVMAYGTACSVATY